MGGYAHTERIALADELIRVGPDAPTLCTGWSAGDLAAHLVVREARPVAALGVVVKPLAPLTQRVQAATREKTPFPRLVERFRQGPPPWSLMRIGPLDTVINTSEYFVHHEDVRRAVGGQPRDLDPDQADDLWYRLRKLARPLFRSSPVGVTLVRVESGASPRQTAVAKAATPQMVTVSGPVGELMLFAFGRKDAARVELSGDDAAVARLRELKTGF
jgi:uncharacterized protein (TIGR03085 family)